MTSTDKTPLLIYTASAGSGKTFRLTRQYLYLVLSSTAKFNNMLAVTFTNKAAFEMKSRIITELYKIANNEKSDHLQFLSNALNVDDSVLINRANSVLKNILNNYSQFALGTIDSFFQTVLKGFLRELKLPVGYDIALNTADVLEKSVNELFEKLHEDNALANWLTEFAYANISNDKTWNIKRDLLSLSREIFSEQYQMRYPLSLVNKEISVFEELNKKLVEEMQTFEKEISEIAGTAVKIIEENNLIVKDFYYGRLGVAQYFYYLRDGDLRQPNKHVLRCYEDLSGWTSKSTRDKDLVDALAHEYLHEILDAIIGRLNAGLTRYNTLQKIKENIYVLGILSNVNKSVLEYCNKNNFFLLAFAGIFLQTVIDNNDTPFVYEKTGSWYQHFMIDEFQDTSHIQWNNFKVLLRNSLSEGKQNIVVGDVKQAIYKWRNSNWHILGHDVERELGAFGVQKFNLDQNWRSFPAIVNFNNRFFNRAPGILEAHFESKDFKLENANNEEPFSFSGLFEGHMQILPKNYGEDEGYVRFEMLYGDEDGDWRLEAMEKTLESIKRLQDKGYLAKDIAILVRRRSEAKEIAEYIVDKQSETENSGYNLSVMSADSLHVASAPAVKILISFLRLLNTPDDDIVKATFILNIRYHFVENDLEAHLIEGKTRDEWISRFLFNVFNENLQSLQNYPLNDIVCMAISKMRLEALKGQTRFILAFQDSVHDYVKKDGGGLQGFLNWQEENQHRFYLSMTEQEDAINIFTIHKSKGLEFKTVIMPFLDWEFEPRSQQAPYIWTENLSEYKQYMPYVPVKYGNSLSETEFKRVWLAEKFDIYCEHLNLLYVAFTRAVEALICFIPDPELFKQYYRTSKLIYNTLKEDDSEDMSCFEYGAMLEHFQKQEDSKDEDIALNFTSFYEKIRIAYNADETLLNASDIENKLDKDKTTLELIDIRDRGKIMHRIFEGIKHASDVEPAVNELVLDGAVTEREGKILADIVKEKVSSAETSEWFSGKWTAQNEAEIILPGGQVKRPDRIMRHDDNTLVVDYKFGKYKRDEDSVQMKEYIHLLTSMGHKNISGAIWYVNLNSVEYVGEV